MDFGSSKEDEQPDDFVAVPVPRSRVLEVMAYLTGDTTTPQTDNGPSNDSLDEQPSWDEASLRELLNDRWMPEKQVWMLEYLAEHAGERVTPGEMADYLGIRGRAVGGVTAALKKRSRWQERQYQGGALPFEHDWSNDLGKYYLMPVEYAGPVKAGIAALREQDPKKYGRA